MKKKFLLLSAALMLGTTLFAQTNPTPWVMNTQGNYSFTSIQPTAGAFPASMVVHGMTSTPATANLNSNLPAYNIPMPAAQIQGSRTNVWALGARGWGFRSNPTSASTGYTNGTIGELVVGLNTTSRENINVAFKAGTVDMGSGQSATFKIRCQYRLGSSGNWSELVGGPIEYTTVNALDSVNLSAALPSDAENQALVQVRWVFYHAGGSFTNNNHRSHRGRVDDISITSQPIVTFPASSNVCLSYTNYALAGSPAGGIYSGTGVSGSSFNAQVAGVGTHPITYTYTDAFGISNVASGNLVVSQNFCYTQLTPAYCGATNLTLTQYIFCDPVQGSVDYQFEFKDMTTGVITYKNRGSNNPGINLQFVPGVQYGRTYQVRARGKIGSSISTALWTDFGPVCTITTEAWPDVMLTPDYCGATNLALSTEIFCTSVAAAQDYQFEFKDLSTGSISYKTRGSANPSILLSSNTSLQYGKTYEVRSRAKVGGLWGNFGTMCTISIMAHPATQVISSQCGGSFPLSSTISADLVQGAGSYTFRFKNPTTGSYYFKTVSTNATVTLSQVSGLVAGVTYVVDVRSYVNGVWSAYGSTCDVAISGSVLEDQISAARAPEMESENKGVIELNTYPNPFTTNLTINVRNANENVQIQLFDLSGRLVLSRQISANGEIIPTADLPAGMYFLNYHNGSEMHTIKLIKE